MVPATIMLATMVIRREALNHFLLFSEKQVRNIISEFTEYYNIMQHFKSGRCGIRTCDP